eukprot:scaffold59842_cov64-Phaeocystis_antarctica.AAC.9
MDLAPPRSGRLPSSRAPTPRASPRACRSEIQVPQTARASLAGPQPGCALPTSTTGPSRHRTAYPRLRPLA